MMQWTTTELDKVASVFNGKTPAKSEQRSEGHPVLKIRDVDEMGLFRGPFESFVDDDLAQKHGVKKVRAGDTLILNAAHNADYVASKTFRATPPSFGALATGEWLVVRPNDQLLDPGFANHWINSRQTRLRLRELVNGIHLYPKDVARLKISYPLLPEQRRIAAILDQAETLRTQRRTALALLDSLTQSLFLEMFGDPVANDRGWPHSLTLGEVADIASGVTKGRKLDGKVTREVPYLAVANVQDKTLRMDGLKTIEATEDEVARYRLQKDDLLLTEGGDPDKLGRGTLWKEELPECIHQNHIFRVRLTHAALHPLFLNWLVGSTRGKNYFLRSAKQTTGIASINMTQLRSFPLLVPPLPLQQTFATRIASIEALKATHRRALAALDALFASLQQRAFAGQL